MGVGDCALCHTRLMPDGLLLAGAPGNIRGNAIIGELIDGAKLPKGDTLPVNIWRGFAVPWVANDVHDSIRKMADAEARGLSRALQPGTFARINGSPFYPTKFPDLIGIGERKYMDHTGTHLQRGPGDLMRYAAIVSCCDAAEFGPHRFLANSQRTIEFRFPDELLFALAQYLYSLQPPTNPNASDARIATGKKVFEREGCSTCHAPPLFTNNKLTPATGFQIPQDHPNQTDIMPISVGTDPGLALRTRKGTGLYKVPSLKGVWYRGLYGHDGSVNSLENWFNADRLKDDYERAVSRNNKVIRGAVSGHEFGLGLSTEDKAALIAFLRSL